jgi:clan AA aspartic protease
MGKVREKVIIKNFGDILKAKEGLIPEDKINYFEVDAIVDTGAAFLCLPPDIIEKLGLLYSHTSDVRTANGNVKRRIFRAAEITIKERSVTQSVMENDRNTPPLIGYLVLEEMDFVVDSKSRKLIGNPEHNGKWVIDLY